LTNLTIAEVSERVIYKMLSESHDRKHLCLGRYRSHYQCNGGKTLIASFFLVSSALFSPGQLSSYRMQVNVAAMSDPAIWRFLERECSI